MTLGGFIGRGAKRAGDLRLLGAILGVALYFGLRTERFLTSGSMLTLANQMPALAMAATGVTFVLISGGVDLSVGSLAALASVAMGVAMTSWGWPPFAAAALGTAAALACGALSGTLIAWRRLPSFVITLGMLEMARGAVYLITNSRTIYVGSRVTALAEPVAAGLSPMFLLAGAAAVAGQFVLWSTVYGRWLTAVGRNETAAHYAGAPVRRVRAAAFAISGLMAGLAGVAQTARMGSANPGLGVGFELDALAAAVIGGVSLSGGRGSVPRALMGVLFISMLGAGLAQIGAQEHTKRLVTGAVLALAIVFDSEPK